MGLTASVAEKDSLCYTGGMTQESLFKYQIITGLGHDPRAINSWCVATLGNGTWHWSVPRLDLQHSMGWDKYQWISIGVGRRSRYLFRRPEHAALFQLKWA